MASDANCQQRICGLGLTILTEWRVGDEIEVEINQILPERRGGRSNSVKRRVRLGRPRARSASILSARSVPHVVSTKLQFEALGRLLPLRHCHNSSIVDED